MMSVRESIGDKFVRFFGDDGNTLRGGLRELGKMCGPGTRGREIVNKWLGILGASAEDLATACDEVVMDFDFFLQQCSNSENVKQMIEEMISVGARRGCQPAGSSVGTPTACATPSAMDTAAATRAAPGMGRVAVPTPATPRYPFPSSQNAVLGSFLNSKELDETSISTEELQNRIDRCTLEAMQARRGEYIEMHLLVQDRRRSGEPLTDSEWSCLVRTVVMFYWNQSRENTRRLYGFITDDLWQLTHYMGKILVPYSMSTIHKKVRDRVNTYSATIVRSRTSMDLPVDPRPSSSRASPGNWPSGGKQLDLAAAVGDVSQLTFEEKDFRSIEEGKKLASDSAFMRAQARKEMDLPRYLVKCSAIRKYQLFVCDWSPFLPFPLQQLGEKMANFQDQLGIPRSREEVINVPASVFCH